MLLRARDIVVRHHPSHPPVVDRVSLEIAEGERVAVIGSNGSGKSTLARALVGLVSLESGTIEGARSGSLPRVGLVLQDPAAQLVAATVADEVALGPEGAGIPPDQVGVIVAHELARLDLAAIAHREPSRLSGGQQQRVAIAAIEACAVDVLVLDEPTAMLDAPARRRFIRSLRADAGRRGIVWITQEADEVAACDRVVVLDAGVVAWSGSRDAYLADPRIAAASGLQLPAAARIVHGLRQRGVMLDEGDARLLWDEQALASVLAGGTVT